MQRTVAQFPYVHEEHHCTCAGAFRGPLRDLDPMIGHSLAHFAQSERQETSSSRSGEGQCSCHRRADVVPECGHGQSAETAFVHENNGGGAAGLDALGLGESARLPTGGGSCLGKVALFVTLAGLAVFGLIGMSFMGRVMVFHPVSDGSGTPKGDCFILDPSWCVSLNVEFVQKVSGIRFPPGAEVIESGFSRFLFPAQTGATVRAIRLG